MSRQIVTRFAPSPTGYLHIGSARTALFNWLYARGRGGKFLLRIEDTDRARSTPEATQAIFTGMVWLGLDYDGEPVTQFDRAERHADVAHELLAAGRAYKCFSSQDEIAAFRDQARAAGRSTLFRSPWRDVEAARHPKGAYVVRIKAPQSGTTVITDQVQGDVTIKNDQLDDMILLRSDGTSVYMLAVVVDDHDMEVSQVIRGDDHLTNTARQILIYKAMEVTKIKDKDHPSLKVLSDHIRATTFLISDGVMPSNEGRGYVLRRIIRRAIRHGYKLGCRKPFFFKMIPTLINLMRSAFAIKKDEEEKIINEIKLEEEKFFETIENGMLILDESIKKITSQKKKILPGALVFKLHDTFGFPLDLTADICREYNLTINQKEFEKEMSIQKNRAREAGKFKNKPTLNYQGKDTVFIGYEHNECQVVIDGIFKDENPTKTLSKGDEGILILNQTPFYAESGGQVGDIGVIQGKDYEFIVNDTYKIKTDVFGHLGFIQSGSIKLKDKGKAIINIHHRSNVKRNHSATHLLHKALKIVLGDHVEQKGSLVDSAKTRFDFSHHKALASKEIKEIETIVNSEILKNQSTQTRLMKIDEAQKEGAMMLFGEKYDEQVRVLNIGNSSELCGGTHVNQTGDIGLFKIQSEIGIASGVRRIEASTGLNLIEIMEQQENILEKLASELKTGTQDIPEKLNQLLSQIKENEKLINTLKSKIASNEGNEIVNNAIKIKNYSYIAELIDNQDSNQLREMIDKLKDILKSAVIILCSVNNNKISFVIGVTDDLTDSIDAGDIAKQLGEKVGGKGGGKRNMAMAGGTEINLIPEAFDLIKENLKK